MNGESQEWEEHGHAVAETAVAIGAAMGFSADAQRRVWVAGLYHDIGKREISRRVTNKPAPLDAREWAKMRLHPLFAEQILLGGGLAEVAAWVRSHHERPDGLGYPSGLSGDEIPLEARILAVADAYEAMITPHPYGAAISVAAAREELRENAGTQFDAAVVEAFLGLSGEDAAGPGAEPGPRSDYNTIRALSALA